MKYTKPIPLRVLRSTSKQAERLLKKQIPIPGGPLIAPEWMTEEQKADWQYAIENAPRDVLKRIDKGVLATFVVAQDAHRAAAIALQQSQLLVKSPKQNLPMQNPYLSIVNRQAEIMIRSAGELGFSPTSRARIELSGTVQSSHSGDWDDISEAG